MAEQVIPETDLAMCPECGRELVTKLSKVFCQGHPIKGYCFPFHYTRILGPQCKLGLKPVNATLRAMASN